MCRLRLAGARCKNRKLEHGGHGGHRGNIHYLDTGWTDRTDEKNLAISRLKSPTGFPEYKPRDLVYPSEPFNPSKSVIWFDVTSVLSVSSVFKCFCLNAQHRCNHHNP